MNKLFEKIKAAAVWKNNIKKSHIALFSVVVILMAIFAINPYYEIRYADANMDCFPYKVWLFDKTDRDIKVGEFIAFRTPENATYIPKHKTWVKKVFAAEGGMINVEAGKPGEVGQIEVNGLEKKVPVKARVTVTYNTKKETFVAFSADGLGRELPLTVTQVIPAGSLYVYSPVSRSYDSRYWGLVKKNEIVGRAYPLL